MTLESPPVLKIEYARRDGPRPLSVTVAKLVFSFAVVPGVAGLCILLLYRLTGADYLPFIGLFSLKWGGMVTFVLAVIGTVNLIRAISRRPRESAAARWYVRSLLAVAADVGLAVVCAVLGMRWLQEPHFRMRVTNATPVTIDRVTIHFLSGDVEVGPLAAGGSTTTRLLWVRHQGMVRITTEARGRMRTKDDRQFGYYRLGDSSPKWRPFDVTVEPAELPKATP